MSESDRKLEFKARYGPWALVAGAAEGLGRAAALALAQRGLHLWLIDRLSAPLDETAAEIRRTHGVSIDTLTVDLSASDAADIVLQHRRARDVGLIMYVAAAAPIGRFTDAPLAEHQRAIAVNCAAPTALLHGLLPDLAARGRGGVVLFSSMAGFQGCAGLSTYTASKAFDLVLAESLAAELEPAGVDVAAVCPGPTRTPAYERSRPQARPAPILEPEAVIDEALARLGRDRVIVPGLTNRLGRWVLSLLGRRRAVDLVSRTTARMYPPAG